MQVVQHVCSDGGASSTKTRLFFVSPVEETVEQAGSAKLKTPQEFNLPKC